MLRNFAKLELAAEMKDTDTDSLLPIKEMPILLRKRNKKQL